MKYRRLLKDKLKNIDIANEAIPDRSDWLVKTYNIKVITPIYGGGVNAGEPDMEMPIRASAIRGQLRYWWRFLAMNRNEKPLAGENLFTEERRIWGGMGDEKELKDSDENDFSSKVFIRCKLTKETKTYQYNGVDQPQYALFPARENKREKIEAKKLIKSGMEFTLTITFSKDVDFDKDIKPALRWWACFGGIGARTRRGLGSIEIENIETITNDDCRNYSGCQLILQDKESDKPEDAWIKAVNTLYEFRQKPGIGRNIGNGQTPGRSKWPEPDSIREITGDYSKKRIIKVWNKNSHRKDKDYHCKNHLPLHAAKISFPRAIFGLPIIFKFKDENCGEPKQTMLLPDKEDAERISSPLILTPYKNNNNKYVPAALMLPTEHINDISLKLKKGDATLIKPYNMTAEKKREWADKNWNEWPSNWWDNIKAQDVEPIKNRGVDALTAFMTFFANGGK